MSSAGLEPDGPGECGSSATATSRPSLPSREHFGFSGARLELDRPRRIWIICHHHHGPALSPSSISCAGSQKGPRSAPSATPVPGWEGAATPWPTLATTPSAPSAPPVVYPGRHTDKRRTVLTAVRVRLRMATFSSDTRLRTARSEGGTQLRSVEQHFTKEYF